MKKDGKHAVMSSDMYSSIETTIVPLCFSALQSPIEYQRRESKSNSLGRSMRPPLSAASALRPHSSASIDRHKLPSLQSYNTSLPALYLPSQGQGPSETLREVGLLPVTLSCSNCPSEVFLFVRPIRRCQAGSYRKLLALREGC